MLLLKSARCEKIYVEISCFLERKEVVSNKRAKVAWSRGNNSKERFADTTTIRGAIKFKLNRRTETK